jgi:hypothetical protein
MRVRTGFTLLELLLATVLSVVLMMGVLAVLTDLSTGSQTFVASEASESPVQRRVLEAWAELLRGDLSHAQSIEACKPNRVVLRGSGALDNRARSRTHRPVEIHYELRRIQGRTWLVRRQRALDVLSNRNVQRDLVCTGVSKFELVAEGGIALSGDKAAAIRQRRAPRGNGGPLPEPEAASQESSEASAWDGQPSPQAPPRVESRSGPEESGEELRTYYDPKTKEVSVMVNGLWYYPRYAPRWAQRQYRRQTGEETAKGEKVQEASGIAGSSDASKRGAQTSGLSGAHGAGVAGSDLSAQPAAMSITWRLRVWTQQEQEPVYDRIVAVQLGGGQ